MFTVRLIAAFADTVIVWSLFYCCILLLLLWFGVGFVVWPALLLVVVFWYRLIFVFVLLYACCMFFVYYLLPVLLVLSARDVRPGWMPPPRWGVYGIPMSEAWVAFLPRGSPYTRSSELF